MVAGRLVGLLVAALSVLTAVIVLAGELPGERRLLTAAAAVEAGEAWWRLVDAGTGYLPGGVVAAMLAMVLVRAGSRRAALLVVLSYAGAVLGTTLIKHAVGRSRPDTVPAAAEVSALAYPSGHATATAALAVAAALVVRRSRPVRLAAPALVVTAAAAQLVLGLHFPSDLLAGWLVAGAWTGAVWCRLRPPSSAG